MGLKEKKYLLPWNCAQPNLLTVMARRQLTQSLSRVPINHNDLNFLIRKIFKFWLHFMVIIGISVQQSLTVREPIFHHHFRKALKILPVKVAVRPSHCHLQTLTLPRLMTPSKLDSLVAEVSAEKMRNPVASLAF